MSTPTHETVSAEDFAPIHDQVRDFVRGTHPLIIGRELIRREHQHA